MFRGLCAIVEAYLIYWALVYYIARRYFKFSREWAVPLASGISICGVSAAIATGSAIKARPMVPIMVSSLVVIFAVVELLILPFVAQRFLYTEPMVAGAWMGLAVKTDGAAVASGAIAESLILAKAARRTGHHVPAGLDHGRDHHGESLHRRVHLYLGLSSWPGSGPPRSNGVPGERVRFSEIWERFPKFILGYLATFVAVLADRSPSARDRRARPKPSMTEANVFRGIFFVMTFFTIGVVSNFRKLWEEGIGKLALVYVLCLFGFIIWIGLAISWIFFHGVKPPLA